MEKLERNVRVHCCFQKKNRVTMLRYSVLRIISYYQKVSINISYRRIETSSQRLLYTVTYTKFNKCFKK